MMNNPRKKEELVLRRDIKSIGVKRTLFKQNESQFWQHVFITQRALKTCNIQLHPRQDE
jgi:hypothetical protein